MNLDTSWERIARRNVHIPDHILAPWCQKIQHGVLNLVDRSEDCMKRIYTVHKDLSTKLIDMLRIHKARLNIFGSSVVNGFVEPKSDIDCVFLTGKDLAQPVSVGDPCSSQSRSEQSFTLNLIAKKLIKYTTSFASIQEKPRARVPYVRCLMHGGQEVDISANRRNGVRNSLLLRSYLAQPYSSSSSFGARDPGGGRNRFSHSLFRMFSLAIKVWGKRTGLIDPAQAYLTSYALNILICYFFLQRKKMVFIPPESIRVPIREPVLPLYNALHLGEDGDQYALGSSLRDFLHFYNHEFDFHRHVVSLSRQGLTSKEELGWTAQDEERMRGNESNTFFYRLCIEDPYEDRLNLGRFVTPLRYGMFRLAFHHAQLNGLGFHDLSKQGAEVRNTPYSFLGNSEEESLASPESTRKRIESSEEGRSESVPFMRSKTQAEGNSAPVHPPSSEKPTTSVTPSQMRRSPPPPSTTPNFHPPVLPFTYSPATS